MFFNFLRDTTSKSPMDDQTHIGVVINNVHPKQRQMVQVRIKGVHDGVPDSDLPWCLINDTLQSHTQTSNGVGGCSIPPIGAKLHIQFDNNSPYFPKITGGVTAAEPTKVNKKNANFQLPDNISGNSDTGQGPSAATTGAGADTGATTGSTNVPIPDLLAKAILEQVFPKAAFNGQSVVPNFGPKNAISFLPSDVQSILTSVTNPIGSLFGSVSSLISQIMSQVSIASNQLSAILGGGITSQATAPSSSGSSSSSSSSSPSSGQNTTQTQQSTAKSTPVINPQDYPNVHGWEDSSGNTLAFNHKNNTFEFTHGSGTTFSIDGQGRVVIKIADNKVGDNSLKRFPQGLSVAIYGDINLAASGKTNIGSGNDINVLGGAVINMHSKGDLNIIGDGNLTVNSKGDITMATNGKLTLGSQGDLTIATKGDLKIGAAGEATIAANSTLELSSSGQVNVEGGGGLINLNTDVVTLGTGVPQGQTPVGTGNGPNVQTPASPPSISAAQDPPTVQNQTPNTPATTEQAFGDQTNTGSDQWA